MEQLFGHGQPIFSLWFMVDKRTSIHKGLHIMVYYKPTNITGGAPSCMAQFIPAQFIPGAPLFQL